VPRVLLLLPTTTYRTADFLEAAERVGVEVVVASEEPSTLERLQSDRLLTLDFLDPEGAALRVLSFHERHPLTAVVPVDEETVVVASAISEALGLPRNEPEAALRARLKHRMREALAESGVPSPGFRVTTLAADPRAFAEELSYPVVLKPVFLSGSRGVMRVDDRAGFVEGFRRLARLLSRPEIQGHGGADADTVLVEDYVPGREVAVEGILTRGTLRMLALFDKPDPLEGPYFEETIYVTPSRLDEDAKRDVVAVTAAAAAAIGLVHGPVHAELRLPQDGRPVVIEIAGRSIGGLCSRTLRFGLGISLEELLLRHALGEDVESLARESRAAGVMMIPIPRAGVLEEVEGLDRARSVGGIEAIEITAPRGRDLVPLPEGGSYLGFIFARGAEPGEVERALREAHAHLRVDIR
jgi:biotin carboxylase